MATIYIHPTLASKPARMADWQNRYQMLIVLAYDKAQAIPHPTHSKPSQQTHSWNGGDAA
jgi:hypothetical protein